MPEEVRHVLNVGEGDEVEFTVEANGSVTVRGYVLMATFETVPRFEADWRALTPEQQTMFRKVVLEAFEPDLVLPDHPFRPALRVRELAGCPGVFEVTWSDDGRATFSYGAERVPGQPHVIWRRIGSFARQVR